jgi:hypothetical protein
VRVYLVAPVPLGALVIGWAVGWGLGVLILIAACLSLGFGAGFWWAWDAWRVRRRKRKLIALASDAGLQREEA